MRNKNTDRQFGPIETRIISRLSYERTKVISSAQIDDMFKLSPNDRRQIVFRLKKKGILVPIKSGVYVFSSLEDGGMGRAVDEMIVPGLFLKNEDYYIGYSSMYNYYGFTDQIFRTIHVLNTSIQTDKVVQGVRYRFKKVSAERVYGVEQIQAMGYNINISSRERTLIDLIYFNKSVGGIVAAGTIFKEQVQSNMCDIGKLVEYSVIFPNINTRKQIGLILEESGVQDGVLKPLLNSIVETSISAMNKSRKGKLIKKWRLIIDDSQKP